MNKTSQNNNKKFLAMTNSILAAYNKTILELKNALIKCGEKPLADYGCESFTITIVPFNDYGKQKVKLTKIMLYHDKYLVVYDMLTKNWYSLSEFDMRNVLRIIDHIKWWQFKK